MRRIFLTSASILFALVIVSAPFRAVAVDSTGGQCMCEIITADSRTSSTSTVSLSSTYDTSDEPTCQSACEQYIGTLPSWVAGHEGRIVTYKVSASSYTFATEAEAEAIIKEKAEEKAATFLQPNLNVDIPGLSFSDILNKDGKLQINFLPEYLNGLYRYALGAGALIAVVMIMIGGAQYIVGSGLGSIEAGKKRMTNAVTGLILLLTAYAMLYVVNPELTTFQSVKLDLVAEIKNDLDSSGAEGSTGGARAANCEEAIADAQSSDSCPEDMQSLLAPTSTDPVATDYVKCGYHFTEKNIGYDYTKMTYGVDFIGAWGDPLYAPGSGTISFKKGTTENRCGNTISIALDGGGTFSICHVKAFEPAAVKESSIKKGDLIGYVGGKCCEGESRPKKWDSASVTGTCSYGGTKCGSPYGGNTACDCQDVAASGNTTGAHAHGSLSGPGGASISILACLSGESSTEETGESESTDCVETTDAEGNPACE